MANKKLLPLVLLLFVTLFALLAFSAAAEPLGDPDNDGNVTAADARIALRLVVGLGEDENHAPYEQGTWQFKRCDINNDGVVDAGDARRILRASIHLDDINSFHDHLYGDKEQEKDDDGNALPYHIRSCEVCDTIDREACTLSEKTYITAITEPTCTEAVQYEQTCSVCSGLLPTTVPALGHDRELVDSKAASCTADGYERYYCKRCEKSWNDPETPELNVALPMLGHIPTGTAMTLDTDVICTRCNDVLIPCFNSIANSLKNGDENNTFKGFEKNSNHGRINTFNLKISAAAKAAALLAGERIDENEIRNEFEQELAADTVQYNSISGFNQEVTNENFPLKDTAYVSQLTPADVKSFNVQQMTGIDFAASLPDQVDIQLANGTSTYPYDLTWIKSAQIGDVVKITVELKEEKYSMYKNSTARTSLQKISDVDIRQVANSFSQDESDAEGFELNMNCKELTSNATVTYYADAVTYEPIAATYDVRMVCDQDILLNASIENINLMNGNMNMTLNNDTMSYFFFRNKFN
ncbi:MAG: dockerin type I repeat-containing protein [Clostridia bacterium]|nr:dockerin type I repeat-containing protein [Clostridia bacterium]